jgi:hypothetical protein
MYRYYGLYAYGGECAECGDQDVEMHHINGNRDNNNIENLIPLCGSCHRLIHLDRLDVPDMDPIREVPTEGWYGHYVYTHAEFRKQAKEQAKKNGLDERSFYNWAADNMVISPPEEVQRAIKAEAAQYDMRADEVAGQILQEWYDQSNYEINTE